MAGRRPGGRACFLSGLRRIATGIEAASRKAGGPRRFTTWCRTAGSTRTWWWTYRLLGAEAGGPALFPVAVPRPGEQ